MYGFGGVEGSNLEYLICLVMSDNDDILRFSKTVAFVISISICVVRSGLLWYSRYKLSKTKEGGP